MPGWAGEFQFLIFCKKVFSCCALYQLPLVHFRKPQNEFFSLTRRSGARLRKPFYFLTNQLHVLNCYSQRRVVMANTVGSAVRSPAFLPLHLKVNASVWRSVPING